MNTIIRNNIIAVSLLMSLALGFSPLLTNSLGHFSMNSQIMNSDTLSHDMSHSTHSQASLNYDSVQSAPLGMDLNCLAECLQTITTTMTKSGIFGPVYVWAMALVASLIVIAYYFARAVFVPPQREWWQPLYLFNTVQLRE